MRSTLLVFLCLLQTTQVWAALSVSASQTQLLVTEQLTLEVELNRASESTPNLTQLSTDFSVLSFERMVLGQANRDHTEYRTRWLLTLRPRRAGELTIPALSIDGSRSDPITVRVAVDPNQPMIAGQLNLSAPPYYVEQPLLVEVNYVHEKPLPTDLQIRAASPGSSQLRVLTDLETQENDGSWVTSQRFALFFTETGTLATPAFELTRSNGEVLAEILPEVINLMPPAYRTERGGWLPAEHVRLEDNWSGLQRAEANTELERVLTLTAVGPLSMQIPELPLPEGFMRVDTQLSESHDPFGVTSQRTETWVTTTGPLGDLQTDATELLWWDIADETTRVVTIPARSLLIEQAVTPEPEPEDPVLSNTQVIALSGATGVLGLTAFTMLLLYRKLKQRDASLIEQLSLDTKIAKSELREARLFISLIQACERNHAEDAQHLLLEWIAYIWTDTEFDSLDSLCLQSGDSQFNLVLFQLIDALSNPDESAWDGETLAMQLKSLRRRYISAGTRDNAAATGDHA